MALLQMPPEILKEIFDHVGTSFFREDLGRLTVSKHWFEFARPTCYKHVTLTQKTLRMLMTERRVKKFTPLKDGLETLDLALTGYQSGFTQKHPGQSHARATPDPNENREDDQLESWTEYLNQDLARLATIAKQSRKLRTLRVHANHSPSSEPLSSLDDYLSLPTIKSLLSVKNLTVLVLDLPGARPSRKRGDVCHICPAIGSLLHTLTTLHLRMRRVCPDALKPRDKNCSLRLREVVINLSLFENLPDVRSVTYSKRCGHSSREILQLKTGIRDQMKSLANRMASPKILRILMYSLLRFELQSLDILTGKTMTLHEAMSWNEDGMVVGDDQELESEESDISPLPGQ